MTRSFYLSLPIPDISTTIINEFGMIIGNQSIKTKKTYVTGMQMASSKYKN